MEADEGRANQRSALIRLFAAFGAVFLLGLGYFVIPLDPGRWPIGVIAGTLVLALVVPVTIRRVRRINESDQPLLEAIVAVVFLLAMAVFGIASADYALAANSDQFTGMETKIDALYFTVATISTVGYGDITPVGQGARALVTIQMLLSFLLIGMAIRLIGGVAQHRVGNRR